MPFVALPGEVFFALDSVTAVLSSSRARFFPAASVFACALLVAGPVAGDTARATDREKKRRRKKALQSIAHAHAHAHARRNQRL